VIAAAIYGASSFRRHRRMYDSNGTTAHRAVEVSSPFRKIGPIPTSATPGFIWPVLDASHRATVSARQLPPRAVAAPRELSASSKGALFFRRWRRRFTALRFLSFRGHRRMHDSNRAAAHGPVKVSHSSQVHGGSWYHAPFRACFLTICEIPFVDSNQLAVVHR
jgi:hypothetical protein